MKNTDIIIIPLVIVLTLLSTISESQIDRIEEPQCIIDGQTSVICSTYEDFDIKHEFELISSAHPNDEKQFDQLIMYYLPVHELPDNTFFDLQFTQISIHQTLNLTSIHTNAFNNTSAFTEHLYLIGTKVLVNNPPEYDLYAAISSLANLKTVTINLNSDLKHEIPENAFRPINGPQNSLEVIAFTGDFVISRINNNAFSAIPNLRRWILFSYIHIESISSAAFDFAQTSADRLELHFKACGLNETSFGDNVFSGSQRPLYVDLDNNQISYIRQNTFSLFFNASPNNTISLANNPLDCDNTQPIQWLFDQRDQLENRVLNAACSDGTLLWDTIGFSNQCDAYPNDVVCSVNASLSLKSEFKRIAQANPTQTYYNSLFINNNPVFTEIPDDVFMGLSFGDIFIDSSPNLTYIHRNALTSTANTTHRFWFSPITQLRDSPPEFDLYYALSTLTNATDIRIRLDPSLTHLIPDNAFRNINGVQNNLYRVDFDYFQISRIGNNAFYEIPSLEFLLFYYTPITRISARAFDFRTASEDLLKIQFFSCQLTDQSFEPNIFSGAQRPLLIDLTNNSLNYLDENIFSSFFAANNRNQIYLLENFLNCSDINRFMWLLQQKDQLESRVLEARCTDGTDFWHLLSSPTITTSTSTTTTTTTTTSTTTHSPNETVNTEHTTPETTSIATKTTTTSSTYMTTSQTLNETKNPTTDCTATETTTTTTNYSDMTRETTTTTTIKSESVIFDFELTFITLGSGISLTCLLGSCILSLFFKNRIPKNDEFKDISENFTLNYGICLILVNIYNIFGLKFTNNTWLCQTWSAIIYYLYITAYLWILLKSIYMQKVTSKLFPNYYAINYIHYAITYGGSVFICIIIITFKWLLEKKDYLHNFSDIFHREGDLFCWLSSTSNHEQFWIMQCPAIVLLTVCFGFIAYSIRNRNMNSNHNHLNRDYSWVYSFTFNYFLFVLTWFMINLYTLLNQTTFIYLYVVLHCFLAILLLAIQVSSIYKTGFVANTPNMLFSDNNTSITG